MPTLTSELFSNIPKHHFLDLYKDNKVQSQKVVDFLGFNKKDVSGATGYSISSIRYDDRIPYDMKERLIEISVICERIAEYFEGDVDKTVLWLKMPNPMLGHLSPRDMIRFGRYRKLMKYITSALSGQTA